MSTKFYPADYNMGDSSRDRIDYTSDIDDLFGNPIESSIEEFEDFEDISISSCVYEPVLIGLKGKKLEARLEKAFYPQYDSEIMVKDADGNSLILPIDDLEFLAFVNRPLQIDSLNINSFSEVVETFRGSSFQIHVSDSQNFDVGLFGVTANPENRYEYIFFTNNNIRNHYQQRRIGEIIVAKHLLSEEILQNVLNKQNHLRSLRLGSIIAKTAKLQPRDIETTLKQARQKEADNSKLHSGDILIRAGLVSPQLVNQSLAFQKKIRRMKVGKLLVDMGYIDEDQMYKVLAEKFRKRFVNIERISPTRKVLAHLSRDLAKKLQVIPISFENKRLVIATPYPERVELSDILREKLSCPFELVVSPRNQIIDVLANIPA